MTQLAIPAGVLADSGTHAATEKSGAPIRIDASPIRNFARFDDAANTNDLGKVTFRGGLVLSSPSPDFGGWSALLLDDEAKSLFAISDVGTWLSGRIVYDGTSPSAITDARLGPLQTPDGDLSGRKRDSDSEAVALESGTIANGTILIGFERRHRITRYSGSSAGVISRGGGLPLPASARKMRSNQGIEALTVLKGGPYKGAPIAFSERLYDASRNHTGWLWTKKGPQKLYLKNIGDFDVTDVSSLDDGTLFVLERRFRWTEGVKMRLRRIPAGDVTPGRTMQGEILLEADLKSQIDNMEGLAVTRLKTGEVLVTMISDDNFSHLIQRTLLLQFTVNEAGHAKARP
ncbi:hypothetical protein DLM45_07190 [Hyphomicrobium methylovorum]|nr:hypothetical protein [Hyphomicrobium methylovorum]